MNKDQVITSINNTRQFVLSFLNRHLPYITEQINSSPPNQKKASQHLFSRFVELIRVKATGVFSLIFEIFACCYDDTPAEDCNH